MKTTMLPLTAFASLLLLPSLVLGQANCTELQSSDCGPLTTDITAPLAQEGAISMCNGQVYSTAAYTCLAGQLCPIIEGTPTEQCGKDCYLPYLYQCFDNTSLAPLFNLSFHNAQTSTFVPSVTLAPTTTTIVATAVIGGSTVVSSATVVLSSAIVSGTSAVSGAVVIPATTVVSGTTVVTNTTVAPTTAAVATVNTTFITSTSTATALNATTPVVVVTTSHNTTAVAVKTTTSTSTSTSVSTSTASSVAPASSSSAPASSSSSKAGAVPTAMPDSMMMAKVLIPAGAMALGLVL